MICSQRSVACLLAAFATCGTAFGKSVEELKKAGDLRGLVARLKDEQAVVRSQAAVALPGVVDRVKDAGLLDSMIAPLIEARFRDPWKGTREYSGRALMTLLNRTKDQAVLNRSVQPLLDALNQGQVERDRRQYAAVALSVVVMRLENIDRLQPRINDLLSSALKDPDEGVRKYAQRALQHTLQKLKDEPTLIIAARALSPQLEHKEADARGYAAVMLSVTCTRCNSRCDDGRRITMMTSLASVLEHQAQADNSASQTCSVLLALPGVRFCG